MKIEMLLKRKTKRKTLFVFFFLNASFIFSQGYNHTWLMGNTSNKMRMNFTDSSYTLVPETRKMSFSGTEGNISDSNGNFIMSSNGSWIANANNDTMLNGTELNPPSDPNGLMIPNANIILPYPGDSTKYILFHHADTLIGAYYTTAKIFYSIINMNLDGGLGGVDSLQKNIIAVQDTFNWGLAACKHANGRDWWIVALKDNSDVIFKILLTPIGIASITTQHLNIFPNAFGNVTQPTFSPDGKKFSYSYSYLDSTGTFYIHDIRLFNFDRCSGNFSNPLLIDLTDSIVGIGLSFSPNSQYLYATSLRQIFQLNTDTNNILASLKIVAQNDTFYSPFPPFQTDFLLMYLAANGKIYITSGNSVLAIHYINYPDSADTLCDVHQHAISLPGFNFVAVPNHPNYYLGCDTTGGCPCFVATEEPNKHNFNFKIFPNPSNGNFSISYLLPQNKEGKLEILDVTGKILYKQKLPMWSTLQNISLPKISSGLYNCIVKSGNNFTSKKVAVTRN